VNDGPSLMTVGPRWQGLGTVLHGDREEFARLELAAAFAGDCGEYVLHPALVDLATSFAQYLPKAEGRYLPFAYDRVTVYRPIPPKCYTHIRHTDTGAGEIITSDIALLDETGAVLVDIGGFAVRRVNPEAIRAGVAAPAPASDAAAATSTKAGAASTQPGRDPNQGLEYGIDPAEGVDALMRVLHRRVGPQVVVCPEGVDRKIARTASLTQDVLTASLADLRLGSSELMPRTLDTPCVAPETNVERTLAEFWQEALGVSEVGVEDSFFELGGDSLVAVQLGSRIREHFRVELPIAAMFDSPNIRTLAVAIEKAMADLVDSLSDEEVAVLLSREPDGDR
jgi:acyl carrier protein